MDVKISQYNNIRYYNIDILDVKNRNTKYVLFIVVFHNRYDLIVR